MSGKKFRFSLESVLELREHETEAARQSLAQAIRKRRQQEGQVEQINQRLTKLNREAPAPEQADLHTLRRYDAFRMDTRQLLDKAQRRLEALREQEQQARNEWTEKRQQEERFQTLRDQEEEEHREKMSDASRDFMDEQAVLRFNRTNRSTLL